MKSILPSPGRSLLRCPLYTGRSLALVFLVVLIMGLADSTLVVADLPRPVDAIVVIGGDHKPERIRRAFELYQQGYAPVVIISAGTRVQEGTEVLPEAEVMRRQIAGLGMPAQAILLEDRSQSTYQNAYYTEDICDARGYRSVLLVTSLYHSGRARRIFTDVFGAHIQVWAEPALQDRCSVCWWFRPDQAKVMLYEGYNWVRYWLGIRSVAERKA